MIEDNISDRTTVFVLDNEADKILGFDTLRYYKVKTFSTILLSIFLNSLPLGYQFERSVPLSSSDF